MMSELTIEVSQQQIDELKAKLASFETAHNEFKSVHVSRRGVQGGRGERGADSTVPGPAGQSIKGDRGEIGPAGASIVGPAGRDGADSQVPGPQGLAGRDAKIKIGAVVHGVAASATIEDTADGQVLHLVLPRGERGETGAAGQSIKGEKGDSITGPRGERGLSGESIVGPAGADSQVAGPEGKAGTDAFVTPADIAHLEVKFRNIWKNDIQAGLRGHFNESHINDNKS
jgi:hypothetical protein